MISPFSGDAAGGKRCDSCDQIMGEVDKFLLPRQVPLKWARMRMNTATGLREADGNECWGCEKTRVNTFGKISQAALNKAREDSEEIMDKWQERRVICGAGNRVNREQFDVQSRLKQQAYVDKFRVGEWVPILEYLNEEAGVDPATLEKLDSTRKQIEYAVQVCKVKVTYDNGEPGVLQFKGGRKTVHIGARTAAEKSQEDSSVQGEADGIERLYGQRATAFANQASGSRCVEDVRRDVAVYHGAAAMQADVAPAESVADTADAESRARSLGFDIFDTPTSPPAKKRRNTAAAPTSASGLQIAEPSDASMERPPATRPWLQKGGKDGDSKGTGSGKGKGTGRGRGKGATLSEVAKGEEMLRSAKEKYADSLLWQNRPKKRVVDGTCRQLSDQATKLLSTSEDGAVEVSTSLNDFCLALEAKFELFSTIARLPLQFVTMPMEESDMRLLLALDVTILNNIIVFAATETLRHIDQEHRCEESTRAFFRVCGCTNDRIISVRLLQMKCKESVPTDDDVSGASHLQQVIYSMWLDRVCRARSPDKFRTFVTLCPVSPVDLTKITSSWEPPNCDIGPETGAGEYSSLMRFDAQILRAMCTDWSKATPLELFMAKICIEMRAAVSVRLASLIRSTGGAARNMWAAMETASKRAVTPATLTNDAQLALKSLPLDTVAKASQETPPQENTLLKLLQQETFSKLDPAICILKSVESLPQASSMSQDDLAELQRAHDVTEKLVRSCGLKLLARLNAVLCTDVWLHGQKLAKLVSEEDNLPRAEAILNLEKWFLHWQVVPAGSDVLSRLAALYEELLTAVQACWTTDAKPTVDGWLTATRLMVKMADSPFLGDLDTACRKDGVPGELLEMSLNLTECALASVKHGHSAAWLRNLLSQGLYSDISKLEVSKLQHVGLQADDLLRSLSCCSKLLDKNAEICTCAHFTTREQMASALSLYLQAANAKESDLKLAGLAEASEQLTNLKEKIIESFDMLGGTYGTHQTSRKVFWDQYHHVREQVAEMKPELFAEAAARAKSQDFLTEVNTTAVCVNDMFACLDVFKCAEAYVKDYDETMTASFELLKQTVTAQPSAADLGQVAACLMLAEIVALPRDDLVEQVAQYYRYASAQFRVLKKDLPSKATERLDRLVKEAKKNQAERDASTMPPPPSPSASADGKKRKRASAKGPGAASGGRT